MHNDLMGNIEVRFVLEIAHHTGMLTALDSGFLPSMTRIKMEC